jgi:8-oxo-dGTP diphosphatase
MNQKTTVRFYPAVEDSNLKFAVLVAIYHGKWVFCKHRARNTYEFPGGKREFGESIEETARRELFEETGAVDFNLKPICVYSVKRDGESESFGMLYLADVFEFTKLPDYEMEEVIILSKLPEQWTYPDIQPKLIEFILNTDEFREITK